ncbi:hypothetical protein IMY05_001G0077200 [Salix suchowensis]|nr:hypothetical protein IMY05_001G0077200 [Salix suchowensis]
MGREVSWAFFTCSQVRRYLRLFSSIFKLRNGSQSYVNGYLHFLDYYYLPALKPKACFEDRRVSAGWDKEGMC